jgi:heme iron utilization protein
MQPTPDFNPAAAAKKLLREGRSGALATLMPGSGDPYCSLVNVATAADGAPLLLISRLAVHTKNILADPRVSLMIDERKAGDPLQGARIMLMGTAAPTQDPHARRRYLDRQPEAEMFAGFGDFAFYRVTLEAAHLVAGFGRIVDLRPRDILTETDDAAELLAAEPAAATRCGSMPPGSSALPTGNGAASDATLKGSNCSSTAPRCGCRFRSACARPMRCATC